MNPLQILVGDCRETLKTIPDGTVQTCVTSPPYWGLRSYLPAGHDDKHREIGQEPTPEAFVETMVEVFREVRRCLHESGTVWLNLGDSYNNFRVSSQGHAVHGRDIRDLPEGRRKVDHGLKEKDLCMIPWRVALALQADGWWLRSVICWHKKSCMPESVTDRPTNSWEPIFLLAKSASYFYDAFAVREDANVGYASSSFLPKSRKDLSDTSELKTAATGASLNNRTDEIITSRNQRNVWHLGPEPFADAHFATFPSAIPKRAIMAGTSERGCCPECFAPWVRETEKGELSSTGGNKKRGDSEVGNQRETTLQAFSKITTGWRASCTCGREDTIPCTVLDPFLGSGTVAKVAQDLGRSWIGCELNEGYTEMQKRRTGQMGLILCPPSHNS